MNKLIFLLALVFGLAIAAAQHPQIKVEIPATGGVKYLVIPGSACQEMVL